MLSDKAHHILRLLCDGHQPTTDDLREELELSSNRQVRNLLAELRDEGIPLQEEYRDRRKHFYLATEDQTRFVKPIPFTERQIEALTIAAEAAQARLAPTPYQQPLAEAVEALGQQWVEDVFSFEPEIEDQHWDFAEQARQDIPASTFRLLARAIRERQSVRLDYYTASRDAWTEDRRLDPYLLAVRQGSWLLVAYCHRVQAVRDFSLAGMKNVALDAPGGEPRYFVRVPGFDPQTHFQGRANAMAADTWMEVKILVEPQAAPSFRRKAYHPSQNIVEERADGRLVVAYRVRGLKGVDAMVRAWGPLVTVLSPEELRDQLTAEFYELAARYLSGPPDEAYSTEAKTGAD